ncbi:MAG: RNA polymerase sigma factor region1.1 domain-containing protein, partial [Rhizobacter sp.]|nr:RNA polymerase sigma factor region1.1 domain-containing protein [Rhizobacter sp.]
MTAKKTRPLTALADDIVAAAKVEAGKPAKVEAGKPAKAAKPKATTTAAATPKEKAKPVAKPPEIDADADVFDIEDGLEGEADAEEIVVVDKAADESDPKVKVKPLRMKVPKSKERALIREFGLDVTTLTEEEVEKRRSELKTLVKMGKTRGFLTQQEINDHLPEKLIEAEVLEAIVKMLNDMGIAV